MYTNNIIEMSFWNESLLGAVLSAVVAFVAVAAFAVGMLWLSWKLFSRNRKD